MKTPFPIITLALLAVATGPVQADRFTPEVFRNDALSIRAGLARDTSQLVYFGDVLTLTVIVSHDPASTAIADIDAAFFASAWSTEAGIRLHAWRQQHEQHDSGRAIVRTEFDFQVLDCPDESTPTCPGERIYLIPRFEIQYDDLEAGADSSRSVRFTPWPQVLRVASMMQRDAEGQLYSFETYFPAGGYPEPMRGENGTPTAVITAGVALAVLIGGLFMWPFRQRRKDAPDATLPRWERQLRRVHDYDDVDDARFVDALRRCLVWYCNDELGIDPFVWLDLAEPGDDEPAESSTAQNHADLRRLFFDLLHNPVGQGAELRTRLEALTVRAGDGRS